MKHRIRNNTQLASGFLLLLVGVGHSILSPKSASPAAHIEEASNLDVNLSIEKTTFIVGETIPIHIRILNRSSEPILIGNDVFLGGGAANLDLTLKDRAGRASPRTELTHDIFPSPEAPNLSTALLGSWMLLRPGNSLMTTVLIGSEMLSFLSRPGSYTLSAEYYSNGLSYPPSYRSLGLTDEDVKSIPFSCWSGKIGTNKIHFRIVSAPKRARG